ncbi:MAG: hypothetical protein A2498_15435 [Lentisphaerae bacterium RIFOXYC12_FULL_60_16]|nr:MAG: hypothetical protein A2498_15435 [Lentisphaerae bacterium RIFOXYC12_FULL_60_16]OGV75054.1 MAG: hypothetical protein A2269_00320 [Lentisphaerae bacterium RIFOXYA12_FULL_60_10]OGV77961.1 MAG: hypothetical protein A2340_00340 [Lentisphaerae bacterium RIFOXYB12_FULL_60_10]
MSNVVMDIPEQSVLSFGAEPDACAHEMRMAAAIKLYEMGRLSGGAAARLAGIPKVTFMMRLGDYGVSAFREDTVDFQEETPLA